MIDKIKQLLEDKNWNEAAALCLQFEKSLNHNPLFYLYQGAASAQLGNLQLAEESFLKASKLNPELIAPYKNLAQIYKVQKKTQAKDALIISTWLDPHDPKPFLDLEESFPELFDFPTADIVFYTGTPWLELQFSPDSLATQPLGGSETAFLLMAQHLHRLGRKIICFCNTPAKKDYEGILFVPVSHFFLYTHKKEIPVLISSRFLHPFEKKTSAQLKILWLHEALGCASPEDIKPYNNEIDHFFILSDYQKNNIQKKHLLEDSKFIKTRNGFITEDFAHSKKEKKKHHMAYISRPDRGLKEAIEVLQRVKKIFPDTILHICAYSQWNDIKNDSSLSELLPLLQQTGVEYHGGLNKKEVANLLSTCDLMLYPNVTDAETSCIAAIEAMAAGTPVITSDRGALPETIKDGVGGEIISFTDHKEEFIEKITQRIVSLFSSPEKLKCLSESTHQRAWTFYQWEQVAKEWDLIFKKSGIFPS